MESSVIFVLMPFGEQSNDVWTVLSQVQDRLHVKVTRADRLPFNPDLIYERVVAAIQSADLIIADLSGENPNVCYELGYAHALGKTVLPISSTDLPFNVRGFFTIRYDPQELGGLAAQLLDRIPEALDSAKRSARGKSARLLEDSPAEVLLIEGYAIRKANDAAWRRPGMYFAEEEVLDATKLSRQVVSGLLSALRDMGRLACVNWKGQPVWVATDTLRDGATPMDGARMLAHKMMYKSLARGGVVSAESMRAAREDARLKIITRYPALSGEKDTSISSMLEDALAGAVLDLKSSARTVRFEDD